MSHHSERAGLLDAEHGDIQGGRSDSDDEEKEDLAEAGYKYQGVPVLETATKRDIILMIFINFLSFVCFAIVLPSLWPFLKSFDQPKSLVGWAVAVNSAGTFVASPFLGKWADKRGVKEAIFVSLLVMIGGNAFYSLSQDVWMLLAARFIVGAAAANYAPASAYLSYATHPNDRTTVMIANSAASILGFILGPAMATGLTFIPSFHIWKFEFNEVTYPGWASVVLAALCLLFLPTFHNIKPRKVNAPSSDQQQEQQEQQQHQPVDEEEQLVLENVLEHELEREVDDYFDLYEDFDLYDHERSIHEYFPMTSTRKARLNENSPSPFPSPSSFLSSSSSPSSLLPSSASPQEDEPGLYAGEGVVHRSDLSSTRVAETNPLAKASTKSIQSLKRLAEPGLPLIAVLLCLYNQFMFYTAFTVFETIGTPYTQHAYGWDVRKNGFLFAGIGGGCIVSLVILQVFAMFFRDRVLLLVCEILMTGGFAMLIEYPFSKDVELIRFLVGVITASVGFSSACAILLALFSKLLGEAEQGLMMGWLSATGSLARVIGPLFASYVLEYVGGSLVFLIVVAGLLSSTALTIIFFMRLNPEMPSTPLAVPKKPAGEKKKKKRRGVNYAPVPTTSSREASNHSVHEGSVGHHTSIRFADTS